MYQSDSRIARRIDHTVLCMRYRRQNSQNFDDVTFNQSNTKFSRGLSDTPIKMIYKYTYSTKIRSDFNEKRAK